ncbi:MAG: CopD family protein [Magnetococcales bacterium]|nr:CopD family protein [Magnetococcales bacterium]
MITPLSVHVVLAIVWVGGMFFAYWILRPVFDHLPLPDRISLWIGILNKFFSWVWVIVVLQPATGYWMVYHEMGGFHQAGLHVIAMHTLGWIMIAIFIYTYFSIFSRMKKMAKEELFPEAGLYMKKIKNMVSVNLVLGVIVSILATIGPFL